MTNILVTPDIVTKESLMRFTNNLVMLPFIDKQLAKEFEKKIGKTVRIRKRVKFGVVRQNDVTGNIQPIEEGTTLASLSDPVVVPFEIDSEDLSTTIEEFGDRYIDSATQTLAETTEADIGLQYKYIYNFAGTPGTITSSYPQVAEPATILNELGVPTKQREGFYSPEACSTITDALADKFIKTEKTTKAIEEEEIGKIAGYTLRMCQSLPIHTVGDYGGTPQVNGIDQKVTYAQVKDSFAQDLVTDGWTASKTNLLFHGDIFTIAGIYSVNPKTLQSTGRLQTFVVNSDTNSDASGNATINISPPIIVEGPYQTVTIVPPDNANITVQTGAPNSQHKQNLVWQKNAITIAFIKLFQPDDGAKTSVLTAHNMSIRYVRQFDILTNTDTNRLEILYALKTQNPAFACRVTE